MKSNHLVKESSPYLKQHSHNPVDWYPWGQEALEKAKKENKPIFLSIGYSTCHWCHVMAHESFEDAEIAGILNKHFISIKVDREEHPELDSFYMKFVQLTTGAGGWPLNVFLTPDLKPFFGGTYFPPEAMYGRPSFRTILSAIIEDFEKRKDEIEELTQKITDLIKQNEKVSKKETEFDSEILKKGFEKIYQSYDQTNGGFYSAPKFPNSLLLNFFMLYYHYEKDEKAIEAVQKSLDVMASGGIFDQLGGGFHRYTVDSKWIVPHFEKMLYDNALLAKTYMMAYQINKNENNLGVAKKILDYVLREMTDEKGGFYSAQDADQEGEEGKFYVWNQEEFAKPIDVKELDIMMEHFGLEKTNFEGKNILFISKTIAELARKYNMEEKEIKKIIEKNKIKLFSEREKREKPGTDTKILASWNGLMISAFCYAYQITRDKKYLDAAEKATGFIIKNMIEGNKIIHSYNSSVSGLLEDYAYLINALIDLYESNFEIKYLEEAEKLTNAMINQFYDDAQGGFFSTNEDNLFRSKDAMDNATPSENSMAIMALIRMARMLENEGFTQKAENSLKIFADKMEKMPELQAQLLYDVGMFINSPVDVDIIIENDENTEKMLAAVFSRFIPCRIVASQEAENMVPSLKGKKSIEGKTTVYVCANFVCKMGVNNVEDIDRVL